MIDTISVPSGVQVAVVGDIHGHYQQLHSLIEKINPSITMWLVSVGDLLDKGFGLEQEIKITNKLQELSDRGIGYVIRGNHELKVIKKAKKNNALMPHLKWLNSKPLSLSFLFDSGFRLTVVHGGVSPKMNEKSLGVDTNICYVRTVDSDGNPIPLNWVDGKLVPARSGGVVWHDVYDRRFGYIASGHAAQKDGIPKFYEHSCNLDSAVYESGILSCQIFDSDGLKELVQVSGPAKYPQVFLE